MGSFGTKEICVIVLITLVSVIVSSSRAAAVELKSKTLEAWREYEILTEKRIDFEIKSDDGFMAMDFFAPDKRERCLDVLARNEVFMTTMETHNADGKSVKIPKGMIHHWIGYIFVPEAKLEEFLPWVQNYDQHDKYFPEVERSRLLARDGDVFDIFLRLKRKKIITVYYNTEHHAEYFQHGNGKVSSKSRSIRISQVDNAGSPDEKELPEGMDSGYLWCLNSYWRFQENNNGILVECESISLSRSIPPVINLIIRGYIKSIAKESLENTLVSIRNGYLKKPDAQGSD